jgi:hypothetical protein
MTAIATDTDGLRLEAARIAFALIRFEEVAASPSGASTPPGSLRVGTEAYVFMPSWRKVPRDAVETFLVGLPSPALLAPTTIRGVIALMLLHELNGDRRRWMEKTLSNFALGLEEFSPQLGLAPTSRILLEFDQESHVFSFAGVREWTQQFPVQVRWSISALDRHDRADACMLLRRSDGRTFRGRSCMVRHMRPPNEPQSGAT